MKITCNTCAGTGERELSPVLYRVIRVIAALDNPTISEIYTRISDRSEIDLTAIHRRVERLLEMGLLKRVARSYPARYCLASKAKNKL